MYSAKSKASILVGMGALLLSQTSLGETCGVIVGPDSKYVAISTLKVQNLTKNKAFVVPSLVAEHATAVVCDRKSIVPAEFDYKVLLAGLPFAIRTSKGVLWLEVRNGQVSVSFKKGVLTDDEASKIQTWLNRIQLQFQSAASAEKSQ